MLATVAVCLVLSACGGNKSEAVPISESEGVGQVKTVTFIRTIELADIVKALPAGFAPTVTPRYAVETYKITYTTIDADGNLIQASGLVASPRKSVSVGSIASNPATNIDPSPVLSYQHPTFTLDAQAPSNHATADEPAVIYASLGYLVSAPDYVGYGSTKGVPHPYLQSIPSAAVVSDLLAASAQWRKGQKIADNGQVFLTGYSEGAYASMATLRLLTQTNASTGTLPVLTFVGAGSYDVVGTLDFLLDEAMRSDNILPPVVTRRALKLLSDEDRLQLRNAMYESAIGDQRDVIFDTTVLDQYLKDDIASLAKQSNVYDWTPQSKITFFHGHEDTKASHESTDITIKTMSARGAGALLERLDCTGPAEVQLNCGPSHFINSVARMAPLARGL